MDEGRNEPEAHPAFGSAEIGALAHLYRGELYRSTVWRTRLDATTNWAVVSTGLALSLTFSSEWASPLPLVTGQDAELSAIQRIIAGEQYVTVYKPIKPLAESAAELAVAVANGEEPPSGLVNGEEDNGMEQVPTVFLETVAVTADNVEDTIIADDFWSVDEICAQEYAQACKQAGIQ